MILTKKKAIVKFAPKGVSKNAAPYFFQFVKSLDNDNFPIANKYIAYIEKCEDADIIPVKKTRGKELVDADRVMDEVDLKPTMLKKRKVKEQPIHRPRVQLIWGNRKAVDTPTIIIRNENIIGLHQNWKIQYSNMTQEFWAWINSINRGFQHIEQFDPFDSYVKQADSWLADRRSISDCVSDSQKDAFVMRELERFACNKLYFLNKYWRYQDASSRTGFSIYKAFKAQALLCYLFDCRWDLDIAKARQVFFTTTFFGLAICEALIHPSFFTKVITADTDKAEETFLQKLRLPFADMPSYIRPSMVDNAHGVYQGKDHFELREKGGSLSSLIKIVPPSIDAVNSGSPDLRYIDEQGLIAIVAEMRNEMKSSAYKTDEKAGRLVKKGQTISWGSSDAIQFPQFETIHRSAMEQWLNRNINSLSAIPLYFNVWARAYFTQQNYDEQYQLAYGDTSVKRQHTITQFHQSFPIDYDDMFLSNPLTLIPLDMIQSDIKRIDEAPEELRCEFGYMHPLYDQGNQVIKSSDQPHHIVGSEFIRCKDAADPRVTVCILQRPLPHEKWVDRYIAGVDPIMGVSGHSKFSKTIIDVSTGLPVALMASRSSKPDYEYMQSLLLSLYYANDVEELIEVNFGAPYMKWLEENGYSHLMIPRKSLPAQFQIQSIEVYGISKKAGANSRHILNAGWEYLDKHHAEIWIRQYFTELKTYVNNNTTQRTKGGNVVVTSQFSYGPKDPDIYFDDAIDSLFYAAIALDAYNFKVPKNLSEDKKEKTKRWVTKRDSSFNLVRTLVEDF